MYRHNSMLQSALISDSSTCTADYNESVPEGISVGSQVTRLVAVDADSAIFGPVTYSILSGNEVTSNPTVRACVCTFVCMLKRNIIETCVHPLSHNSRPVSSKLTT